MTNNLINSILEIPAETQTVEFKRLGDGENIVKKIIETIVAMTNTDGGTIVLGIDDPEKTKLKGINRIFGIEENQDIYDALGRQIQQITPSLSTIENIDLLRAEETDKTIALIRVPKSTDNFRSINNKVFVRQQKGNKQLTPPEIIKFSYIKGFEKADRELVEVDFDLLETEYYQAWKNERNISGQDIKKVLAQTGLARKNNNNALFPTRAAVLLFANYPTTLMETKCAIRVFQYTGTIETFGETPNLLGKPRTIDGQSVKLIKEAQEYVLTLLRTGIKISSGFINQYQIPDRAIKEAITNAVIHRDYHTKRDIEIRIFEDRVEIESPGLLPYNITKSNIGYVRADGYRNDLLVKHLREFPEPPNLDLTEGIRAMRKEMKAQNLYPPIFLTYPILQDAVRVVLFNEVQTTEWEKIESYLKINKYINNAIARKITGIKQLHQMSRLLKKWFNQGSLIKIIPKSGSTMKVKYRLPNTEELNYKD